METPDLSRFPGVRILLLGTGDHLPEARSGLPAVPAVAATLRDLKAALIDRCGVAEQAVEIGLNLDSVESMGELVATAAEQARGLLLVYYVGHGVVAANGTLHLATTRTITRNDRAVHTALPYGNAIGNRVRQSGAHHRIVILDCCFSGRALDGPGDPDHLAGHTELPNSFVLTSASRVSTAIAPPGARHTLFSGALIRLLRDGIPDGPAALTLDALWQGTVDAMRVAGPRSPAPRCRADGGIGQLTVAVNAAYRARHEPAPVLPVPAGPPVSSLCPYRGLEGFDVGDARWFYGRDTLTAALVRAVAEQFHHRRFATVLIGASGAGKSSLLRAGLLPGLARGELQIAGSAEWPVRVFDASGDPMRALAGQIASLASRPADDVLELARRDPGEVGALLPPAVLVIDQFEEALVGGPDDDLRAFVDVLHASAALVVLSMRADAYGRLAESGSLAALLHAPPLVVPAMSTTEIIGAIQRPAKDVGLAIEDGLTEQLLADLGVDRAAAEAYEPGKLPLLSHALRATWQQRTGNLLTLAGYRRTGGLATALATAADTVMAEIDQRYGEAGTRVAERILLRLVHLTADSEPARLRLSREQVLAGLDAGVAGQVLRMLAGDAARLVSTGRELAAHRPRDTVTLTHEALLREWPALRKLIGEHQALLRLGGDLRTAAEKWQVSRNHRHLYQGDELAVVRGLSNRAALEAELAPDIRTFLDESIAYEDRQVRRSKVRLALAASLSVLLLVTSATLVVMWRRAAEAGRVALARQLVAESAAMADADSGLAALLAVAAYRIHPDPASASALYRPAVSPIARRIDTAAPFMNASPDGRLYAAPPEDRRVDLRYVADGRLFRTIVDPEGPIGETLISPDGRTVATGAALHHGGDTVDSTVRLWDAATGSLRRTLIRGTGTSVDIAFSPDGSLLAATANPSSVKLWNVRTGQVRTLRDPRLPTLNASAILTFSPDGRTLAYSANMSEDAASVLLFDVRSGRLRATSAGYTGTVNDIAFSLDSLRFATAGEDMVARLWDTGTGRLVHSLSGHDTSVGAVAFNREGQTLATGGADGGVRLWSTADGRLRAVLAEKHVLVEGLRFASEDDLVVAGLEPTMWDVSGLRPRVLGHSRSSPDVVQRIAFSPDGRFLAVAGDSGDWPEEGVTATYWDLARGTVRRKFAEHTGGAAGFAVSPDGSTVAAPGRPGTVRIWDPSGERPEAVAGGFRGQIVGLAYLPDGQSLMAVGHEFLGENSLVVQRYRQGGGVHVASELHGISPSWSGEWAMSPDGSKLILPAEGALHVVDLATGSRRELSGLEQPIGSMVAVSPDGQTVATSGHGQPITLWNIADGKVTGRLSGGTDIIDQVRFSPDGLNLVTAGSFSAVPSDESTLQFWDLSTRQIRASFSAETRFVNFEISPDGRTLATGGEDGAIRLWDFGPTVPAAAVARICAAVGRDLTDQERTSHLSAAYSTLKVCP